MRSVGVVLFGLGNVGTAVVEQLWAARALHESRFRLRFGFLALCDSSAAVGSEGAHRFLGDDDVRAAIALKRARSPLSSHNCALCFADEEKKDLARSVVLKYFSNRPLLLVDCTASDATIPALLHGIQHLSKVGVVTANKRPLSSSQEAFDALTSPRCFSRLGASSTVGAGTPIVAALNRLVASGDVVRRIQGTFSGTLGFLMTGLGQNIPFSDAVQEAFRLGYTEPDPRDDLGGMDVARKALILARLCGLKLEMNQVKVEPLYPHHLASVSVQTFMDSLSSLNADFAEKNQLAQASGKVLRYVATVDLEKKSCSVGLEALDKSSPIGQLTGTQNMVEYHTEVYGANPVVVQGAGAGPRVTAAGIIADMVVVSHCLSHNEQQHEEHHHHHHKHDSTGHHHHSHHHHQE